MVDFLTHVTYMARFSFNCCIEWSAYWDCTNLDMPFHSEDIRSCARGEPFQYGILIALLMIALIRKSDRCNLDVPFRVMLCDWLVVVYASHYEWSCQLSFLAEKILTPAELAFSWKSFWTQEQLFWINEWFGRVNCCNLITRHAGTASVLKIKFFNFGFANLDRERFYVQCTHQNTLRPHAYCVLCWDHKCCCY